MRIFALVNCVQDALKIAQNVKDIDGINVANVGRFTKDADDATQLSSTLMLRSDELAALKELVKLDVPVFHQVVPNNVKTPIASMLKNS